MGGAGGQVPFSRPELMTIDTSGMVMDDSARFVDRITYIALEDLRLRHSHSAPHPLEAREVTIRAGCSLRDTLSGSKSLPPFHHFQSTV